MALSGQPLEGVLSFHDYLHDLNRSEWEVSQTLCQTDFRCFQRRFMNVFEGGLFFFSPLASCKGLLVEATFEIVGSLVALTLQVLHVKTAVTTCKCVVVVVVIVVV